MGVVHPNVMNDKGLKNEVLVFTLNLDSLDEKRKIKYKNFSRYPISQRDLAFVVEDKISNTKIIKLIKAKAGKELVEIRTFDIYQGKNVPMGNKSVAFNLKWQSQSKTLIDEFVDAVVKKNVNSLSREIKAKLRS
jgi:phenylalanyl-tRNA synthetase beta chain